MMIAVSQVLPQALPRKAIASQPNRQAPQHGCTSCRAAGLDLQGTDMRRFFLSSSPFSSCGLARVRVGFAVDHSLPSLTPRRPVQSHPPEHYSPCAHPTPTGPMQAEIVHGMMCRCSNASAPFGVICPGDGWRVVRIIISSTCCLSSAFSSARTCAVARICLPPPPPSLLAFDFMSRREKEPHRRTERTCGTQSRGGVARGPDLGGAPDRETRLHSLTARWLNSGVQGVTNLVLLLHG